jgi:ribosomal protein S18 acetylase RimI-like enzyme
MWHNELREALNCGYKLLSMGCFVYFWTNFKVMTITHAISEDIKELNKLVNSAYRGDESKKGWTTEAEILDGIRIDEAALEVLLTKPEVVVLKCNDADGKIIGTVCLEVKADQLYLGMFAVSPVAQGKGIGKLLMKASEKHAIENKCDRIVISVISTRKELIDWYERHGYVATGGAIAFEDIEGRFGDPKVSAISLIEMQKMLSA